MPSFSLTVGPIGCGLPLVIVTPDCVVHSMLYRSAKSSFCLAMTFALSALSLCIASSALL